MRCFICDKQINDKNNGHIYFCAKKSKLNLNKVDIRFKQICYEKNIIFTKELLIDHYIKLKWSLPDFKKKYNLAYKQTQFLLDYFKIKKRDSKEANGSKVKQLKYKNTCKGKYGVTNVSQSEEVKEKKKETFIKNYGVDNIWKSKEYYEWFHSHMLAKYGKKSLSNRYGNLQIYWNGRTKAQKKQHMEPAHKGYRKYWAALTDEQKNEIIRKRCKKISYPFTSKLETRISAILTFLNIPYQWQFWINRKSYDFRISKTKIIIEVNGDYWHANPNLYKSDDIINYPDGRKKASEIWGRDDKKRQNAEKYGYQILYIWESELNKIDDVDIEEFIVEKIRRYSAITPNKLAEKE